MSAVSKIPHTRQSRIAGPSKLPSRILRPTFTNKPAPSIPSFVNSAKQLETKKESLIEKDEQHNVDTNRNIKGSKQRSLTSSLPGKTEARHADPRTLSVDCNGNKSKEADLEKDKEVETFSQQNPEQKDQGDLVKGSQTTVKKIAKNTTERGADFKNTVDSPSKDSLSPMKSGVSPERSQEDPSPSFRSMKPGYFQQKVNAIKTSQQKSNSEKSNIALILSKYKLANSESSRIGATNFTLPSTSGPSGYPAPKTSSRADENKSTLPSSLVKTEGHGPALRQPSTTVPRSRMMQPASAIKGLCQDSHTNPSKISITRAEKRKKYLEAKNTKTAHSSENSSKQNERQTVTANDQTQKESSIFQNGPSHLAQPSFSFIRRPFTGTRQPRNAKIARPVVRPKSTLSPTVAKPFVPNASQQTIANEPNSQHNKDEGCQKSSRAEGIEQVANINQRGATSDFAEKSRDTDRHSVTSAVSEESGYDSVASSVFLDSKIKGTKGLSLPSTAFGQRLKWPGGRPHQSDPGSHSRTEPNYKSDERSPSLSIDNGQSQITNKISKENRDDQQQRYKDYIENKEIVTYGQYRLETEGNYAAEHRYGITESQQIRSSHGSSSSECDNLPDRESPTAEGESTSDSSAETVIPKNRSPVELPLKEKLENLTPEAQERNQEEDDKDEHNSSFPDEVFKERHESVEKTVHNQSRIFHFSSEHHETTFTSTCSPEPNNIGLIVTPNSNSSLKAKKRKTDSILMSPLQLEDEKEGSRRNHGDPAVTQAKFEREIFSGSQGSEQSEEDEYNSEEEDLSALIDLPSLHESALMADYEEEEECEGQRSEANGHSDKTPLPQVQPPLSPISVHSTQNHVINKLLSNGLDGIIRNCEDLNNSVSPINNSRFLNGHAEHENCLKSGSSRKRINQKPKSSSINELEILQECRALKVTLQQLYFILEKNEEENTKLHAKNEKLNQKVLELTNELNALSVGPSATVHKECQTNRNMADACTGTDSLDDHEDKQQKTSTPVTTDSPRWYHNELSTKVQSNIEEATEEIKYLKTLRGDFDSRIHLAEERLNCALELLHK